jgi:hypothetical protein
MLGRNFINIERKIIYEENLYMVVKGDREAENLSEILAAY